MSREVTRETICLHSADIVAREIEGEIVIVPLVSGIGDADDELYTLNEPGRLIWQKLDGEKTLGAVITELENDFSSPTETIEVDVLGFAAEMIKRGILVKLK